MERSIVWWPGQEARRKEFPQRPGLSSVSPCCFQPHPGPQNPHLKEGGKGLRNVFWKDLSRSDIWGLGELLLITLFPNRSTLEWPLRIPCPFHRYLLSSEFFTLLSWTTSAVGKTFLRFDLRAFTVVLSLPSSRILCVFFLNTRLSQNRLRFTVTCGLSRPVQACHPCHSRLSCAAAEQTKPQRGGKALLLPVTRASLQFLHSGCALMGQDKEGVTKPTRSSMNPSHISSSYDPSLQSLHSGCAFVGKMGRGLLKPTRSSAEPSHQLTP